MVSFFVFSIQLTVHKLKFYKYLPMTGFESRTSEVRCVALPLSHNLSQTLFAGNFLLNVLYTT